MMMIDYVIYTTSKRLTSFVCGRGKAKHGGEVTERLRLGERDGSDKKVEKWKETKQQGETTNHRNGRERPIEKEKKKQEKWMREGVEGTAERDRWRNREEKSISFLSLSPSHTHIFSFHSLHCLMTSLLCTPRSMNGVVFEILFVLSNTTARTTRRNTTIAGMPMTRKKKSSSDISGGE